MTSPYFEATFSRDFVDQKIQRQLTIVHTVPDKEKLYEELFCFADQSMRYDFDIKSGKHLYTTDGHTITIEPDLISYTHYKLAASKIPCMERHEKEEKHIWTRDENSDLITGYTFSPMQKIKRDSVRSSKRPETVTLQGDEAIEQFESFKLPFIGKRNTMMPYKAIHVDYASLKGYIPVKSKYTDMAQRLFSKKQDAFIRFMQGTPVNLKECVDMYYNTGSQQTLKLKI